MPTRQWAACVTTAIEGLAVSYRSARVLKIRWGDMVMNPGGIVQGEAFATMMRGYVTVSQVFLEIAVRGSTH